METFYRGEIMALEEKKMPTGLYKKILVLLKKSAKDSVFVPIRPMQYLSIIGNEEINFVYTHNRRVIEFSWRRFSHGGSLELAKPLKYQVEHYLPSPQGVQARIQGEFEKSIDLLNSRLSSGQSKIIEFKV